MKKLFFLMSLIVLGVKADEYLLAVPVDSSLIHGVQGQVHDIFTRQEPFNLNSGHPDYENHFTYDSFKNYHISLLSLKDPKIPQVEALEKSLENLNFYKFNINLDKLFLDTTYLQRGPWKIAIDLTSSLDLNKLESRLGKYDFINAIILGLVGADSRYTSPARDSGLLKSILSNINVPSTEITVDKLVLYKSQDGGDYVPIKTYDLKEQSQVEKIIDSCLEE